jgi:lysophospholipase L1-like esterase
MGEQDDVISGDGATGVLRRPVHGHQRHPPGGLGGPTHRGACRISPSASKRGGAVVIGTTIIPRHNRPARGSNSGWNPEKTRIRREVNDWIRTSGAFDGVIDFDAVVRDSADPDRIAAAFDCDGIHPNPRGYFEMGGAVPLELFSR